MVGHDIDCLFGRGLASLMTVCAASPGGGQNSIEPRYNASHVGLLPIIASGGTALHWRVGQNCSVRNRLPMGPGKAVADHHLGHAAPLTCRLLGANSKHWLGDGLEELVPVSTASRSRFRYGPTHQWGREVQNWQFRRSKISRGYVQTQFLL